MKLNELIKQRNKIFCAGGNEEDLEHRKKPIYKDALYPCKPAFLDKLFLTKNYPKKQLYILVIMDTGIYKTELSLLI